MTTANPTSMGKMGRNELPPHLDENLLTPRFYTTEFDKASKTDLEIARKDFEAIFKEMEADYNLKHFHLDIPQNNKERLEKCLNYNTNQLHLD